MSKRDVQHTLIIQQKRRIRELEEQVEAMQQALEHHKAAILEAYVELGVSKDATSE